MSGDRLTARDWTDAGLKALAKSGFTALKADALSKVLGVSRGSFYWHFADVDAFHAAVLQRWREVAYENIVEEIEGSAEGRLQRLVERAFNADMRLERAVRAWATSDARVRAAVETVEDKRLRYLQRLLVDAGVDANRAMARARILHWAYLGHALSPGRLSREVLQPILDDLTALVASRR